MSLLSNSTDTARDLPSLRPAERFHIESPYASSLLGNSLSSMIQSLSKDELVIVCIGTDRSTGDSLGPLVGTKLSNLRTRGSTVYGTLENPVHAVNLADTIEHISSHHINPTVIAIDACLGKIDSVGYINISRGPLKPGTGVNKTLPSIGDLHITGVVNVGGFMEYLVLQNTRLHLVMKMADAISRALRHVILCNEWEALKN